MNSKNILILTISIELVTIFLVIFMGICALISERQKLIYYRDWKETYDSKYCPTCGHILESEETENE